MQIRYVWRQKRNSGAKSQKIEYLCKCWIYRVEILQGWCTATITHFDSGYDVTIATYSLLDPTFLKWKLPYLLLQSLADFLVFVLCNVHIRSHPLNEQQEQITLLEGGKLWFSTLNEESLEPILLPWKSHKGNFMKLCEECNNCTEFQFYPEKVMRDIRFFVILHHFVSLLWRHTHLIGIN